MCALSQQKNEKLNLSNRNMDNQVELSTQWSIIQPLTRRVSIFNEMREN